MALKEAAKEHVKTVAGKVAGGVVGLVVAGGLMWFTPLIDRYVKPAKPLANFSSEEGTDSLTVTFKNLSQNAKQAKWDFGDGTPLEIVEGDQTELKHKFKKPNTYKVRLVVSNVVNQEDSRESTIAVGIKPQILDLSMKPLNQKTKPFTAGVKIKFEATADLDADLEWDFGDGIYQTYKDEVIKDFPLPGKHLVKVRAIMGHQKGAPSMQEIEVLPQSGIVTTGGTQSPSVPTSTGRMNNTPKATLPIDVTIRSQLTPDVLRRERLQNVTAKGKSTSSALVETIKASPGYVIKSAKFSPTTLKKTPNIINESIITAEDGKSLSVKAQLTKMGSDYLLTASVVYVEELDPNIVKESKAVTTAAGSVVLELPFGNKHELEFKFKDQVVFKQSELPIQAVEFSLEGRKFEVASTKNNGKVTLQIREIPRRLTNQTQ